MTLVLPSRLTASARSIRDAAHRRGLPTVSLPSAAVPQGLSARHLHAGPTFADAVAPALGIALLQAPEDWLPALPQAFTRREIRALPLGEAYTLRRPAFVKSPNDKSVPARVYADGSRLPGPDALDPGTTVLVGDVVRFTEEHRLFLLDGAVHTAARYAEDGRLRTGPPSPGALAFGARLLAAVGDTLPSAVVVDVGRTAGGWAVVEANAAWACGRYTADADRALEVILRAAGPLSALTCRDRPFVRRVSPAAGTTAPGPRAG
ncbi:ATP-grasp domain-containing protein [Streptomyces ginkgonis]|uniref:ATP-grasp domain-containing protein n=1 Tax=Streptomyces ginkgonis TaxID=1812259 RepID=UPI002176E094|nr:ATP-grasp domain-containing protein [Streptomyces ginkgonis]